MSYLDFCHKLVSSSYGPLPDLSCFDPIEIIVEKPEVNKNEVANSTDKSLS